MKTDVIVNVSVKACIPVFDLRDIAFEAEDPEFEDM